MAPVFQRRKAVFKVQPRLLVLCEDTKSCLVYLQEAAHHFRAYADVAIAHCGRTDPKGIVMEASKRLSSYDQVFCAIDRDTHHGFDEALAIAARTQGKVEVIASFPCYEFWLYLHFKKSRKPYQAAGNDSAADRVLKDLRKCAEMTDYGKGKSEGLFGELLARLPRARVHAAEVLAAAEAENELNPSTRLHDLIALFESLAQPLPNV
jgi:hypothetical protein